MSSNHGFESSCLGTICMKTINTINWSYRTVEDIRWRWCNCIRVKFYRWTSNRWKWINRSILNLILKLCSTYFLTNNILTIISSRSNSIKYKWGIYIKTSNCFCCSNCNNITRNNTITRFNTCNSNRCTRRTNNSIFINFWFNVYSRRWVIRFNCTSTSSTIT